MFTLLPPTMTSVTLTEMVLPGPICVHLPATYYPRYPCQPCAGSYSMYRFAARPCLDPGTFALCLECVQHGASLKVEEPITTMEQAERRRRAYMEMFKAIGNIRPVE